MSQFIKLHLLSGKPVLVNLNRVNDISSRIDMGSYICYNQDVNGEEAGFAVMESHDSILNAIQTDKSNVIIVHE